MPTARILVMDDEQAILNLAREFLQMMGHQVDTAIEGAAAVSKYREAMNAGRPFDLVIMDLTVPEGMNGVDTMARLLEMDPDVSVVVSSGYADDPVISNLSSYGFQGVVLKPWPMDELRCVVEGIIKQRAKTRPNKQRG